MTVFWSVNPLPYNTISPLHLYRFLSLWFFMFILWLDYRHSAWKLQYLLMVNGSMIPAEQLTNIDLDLLATSISNIKGIDNHQYAIVKSTTDYFNYDAHFSVLVDKMVTQSAKSEFELNLLSAWEKAHPSWTNLSVHLFSQEEIVDQYGWEIWLYLISYSMFLYIYEPSLWRLKYFQYISIATVNI